MDPEDVRAVLREYHEHLRSDLEHFGGTVEKCIADAVVAVFGAPAAHEDDAERAVRAALAIRDWALDEGDVELRVAANKRCPCQTSMRRSPARAIAVRALSRN